MDIGRAYTFITSDPKWISKVLIGAAVSLVPILNFALYGYALDVLRQTFRGNDLPLPEWDDFGDYFVRGLLVAVGTFIWLLPLLVLLCPVIVLGAIAESQIPIIVGLACLIPVGIVLAAVFGQVVIARYAISRDFSTMFEFAAIFDEARRGVGLLLLCILVYVVASILGLIAGIVTCTLGFFVIAPWLTLAHAHLLGQAYREMRGAPQAPPAEF